MSTRDRSFEFVGWGARARDGALCCDGLVEGDALHLSHWPRNRTPTAFKADTSVEIALRYGREDDPARQWVVNNHFDTDGVLAVWALLHPDHARAHRDVIVAAAEVGDFEEWSADPRGVWLDAAVQALRPPGASDAEAYTVVLPLLADTIEHLAAREALWSSAWQRLEASFAQVRQDEAVQVARVGRVAVFAHAAGTPECAGPVLSRIAPSGCDRWLLAFDQGTDGWMYRYERPRWAWADTVVRPRIAPPSRNAIVRGFSDAWRIKGDLGMVGITTTQRPVREGPTHVARALADNDPR